MTGISIHNLIKKVFRCTLVLIFIKFNLNINSQPYNNSLLQDPSSPDTILNWSLRDKEKSQEIYRNLSDYDIIGHIPTTSADALKSYVYYQKINGTNPGKKLLIDETIEITHNKNRFGANYTDLMYLFDELEITNPDSSVYTTKRFSNKVSINIIGNGRFYPTNRIRNPEDYPWIDKFERIVDQNNLANTNLGIPFYVGQALAIKNTTRGDASRSQFFGGVLPKSLYDKTNLRIFAMDSSEPDQNSITLPVVPILRRNPDPEPKSLTLYDHISVIRLISGKLIYYNHVTKKCGWQFECVINTESIPDYLVQIDPSYKTNNEKNIFLIPHSFNGIKKIAPAEPCGGISFFNMIHDITPPPKIIMPLPDKEIYFKDSVEEPASFFNRHAYDCPFTLGVGGFDHTTASFNTAILKGAGPYFIDDSIPYVSRLNNKKSRSNLLGNYITSIKGRGILLPYENGIQQYAFFDSNIMTATLVAGMITVLDAIPGADSSLVNYVDLMSRQSTKSSHMLEIGSQDISLTDTAPIMNPLCTLLAYLTRSNNGGITNHARIEAKLRAPKLQYYLSRSGCRDYGG